MSTVLQLSDSDILLMVQQLRALYQRKRPPRSGADRGLRARGGSIFEHTYSLHFLARHFAQCEGLPRTLDMDKVKNIITYRDVGDVPGGNHPGTAKTGEYKWRKRRNAAEAFRRLPVEMRGLALSAWDEYEEGRSLEARFVSALVKLEPCLRLNDPVGEHLSGRLERNAYEAHAGGKLEAVNEFPVMRRFVLAIADSMRGRGPFQASPA